MPKMGMGMRRVHVTMGTERLLFHVCQNSRRSTHTGELNWVHDMASLMPPVSYQIVLIGYRHVPDLAEKTKNDEVIHS